MGANASKLHVFYLQYLQGPGVQDMSKGRAYYQLISYGDAVYALGGHDGSELNTMERWTRGEGWVNMANLPYTNHRWGQSLVLELSTNPREVTQCPEKGPTSSY